MGNSKKRLKEVQKDIGDDLFTAQAGRMAPSATEDFQADLMMFATMMLEASESEG